MTKGDRESVCRVEWGSGFEKWLLQRYASLKAEYTGVARVRKQRTPFANETRGNVDKRESNAFTRCGGTCSQEDGCARPSAFQADKGGVERWLLPFVGL